MTSNQVSYWKNQETERANRESERLRGAELALAHRKQEEEERHNAEQEGISERASKRQMWSNIVGSALGSITTVATRGIAGIGRGSSSQQNGGATYVYAPRYY